MNDLIPYFIIGIALLLLFTAGCTKMVYRSDYPITEFCYKDKIYLHVGDRNGGVAYTGVSCKDIQKQSDTNP